MSKQEHETFELTGASMSLLSSKHYNKIGEIKWIRGMRNENNKTNHL